MMRNMNMHSDTMRIHVHNGLHTGIVTPLSRAGSGERATGGLVTGNQRSLRPSLREDLARLSRLGIRPDHLWEESFVRRMAWIAFQADRELTAWLSPDGGVAELRLGERNWTDLSGGPTDWCIHAAFGERRTLPEQERQMLLHGEASRVVSVGVCMGLPGTICMGWRSPAGTGGVILYGPIRKGQAG